MKKILTLLAFAAVAISASAEPATTAVVKFDYNTQRFLGNVSALNRSDYFNIHSTADSNPIIKEFMDTYDVSIGRTLGGPLSYAGKKAGGPCIYNDAHLPKDNMNHEGVRQNPRDYIHGDKPTYIHGEMDTKAAAEWVAKYFCRLKDSQYPEIFEPLNEGFVHAKDKMFRPTPTAEVKRVMSRYHLDCAIAIRNTPYLSKMKIIGDGAAYPSYEIANFKQWEDNTQVFLDIAGAAMDGISVHLYDGINIEGQATKRSGSNSEAILDLLETYTENKCGGVKPLCISEFGAIIKIPGTNDGDLYHEDYSPNVVLSMNHIFHNLMERQDNILPSVLFIGDMATWYLNNKKNVKRNSYTSVLFVPEDRQAYPKTNWVINDKVYFFELWKDVKGDRVEITTSNPDIQSMAFRDGNILYLALDNLHDTAITTSLESLAGTSGIKGAELRSLTGSWGKGLTYKKSKIDITKPLTLQSDECAMVVIKLKKNTPYKSTITRTKYYSQDQLMKIEKDKKINFNFSQELPQGEGRANLRMSIGRPIALTKCPKVWVNGTEVEMPTNWKGYDQADRRDFFGMIEIPVDLKLLKKSGNVVSVQFTDAGGRVSSMIIEKELYAKK